MRGARAPGVARRRAQAGGRARVSGRPPDPVARGLSQGPEGASRAGLWAADGRAAAARTWLTLEASRTR
jgi:hypothetical protein